MAQSDQPKVPPTQQHRSSGDTGVPQRGANMSEGMSDDPRQAAESGEPAETGRSHGRVIDESGEPQGDVPQKGQAAKDEHWESGRHKAE
jgi:hypothetical protein